MTGFGFLFSNLPTVRRSVSHPAQVFSLMETTDVRNWGSEEIVRRKWRGKKYYHDNRICSIKNINYRYFYDKFEQKCVKFGGCSDMDDSENNFETRQDCISTCIGKLSGWNLKKSFQYLISGGKSGDDPGDSISDVTSSAATSSSHVATVVVEVILSLAFLAMLVLASYLGWKHYTLRRNSADSYRMFGDSRSNSVISGKKNHPVKL